MPFRIVAALCLLALATPGVSSAQGDSASLLGTWEAKADAEVHEIIIRQDSSASYGTETVRWRVQSDTILIALGGEWVCYRLRLKGDKMTLSEGDLQEPITLTRIGPPSARPDTVAVPEDPMPGESDVCF
jgi:hypothetical protein